MAHAFRTAGRLRRYAWGTTVTSTLGCGAIGDGHSLVEIANGHGHDRIAFSEYHDGGSRTGSFAVRSGPWKYIEHVGYQPELYNLHDDPAELNDLGADPRCVIERTTCADALRSICDPDIANREAFASQRDLMARLGGREAVANAFRFNATPAPLAPSKSD